MQSSRVFANIEVAPKMPVIVIMGVSGSGKSVVGRALSVRLNVPFCEGDNLHPAANIAKMKMGNPLDDVDRAPWLARVASWIKDHPGGGVVTCSALRRRYRNRLREDQLVLPSMVLLDPPPAVVKWRLDGREVHFMLPAYFIVNSEHSNYPLSMKRCSSWLELNHPSCSLSK